MQKSEQKAPEQMDQDAWFKRLEAHRIKQPVPKTKIERLRIAMNWWNKLPRVDQQAQSASLRSAAEITEYYWSA